MYFTDTIAAIATPPGSGGVGIVRISGPKALEFGHGIFTPKGKTVVFQPRRMYYGSFVDSDQKVIDYGLMVFFPGPDSFTGEDVSEIHCHGGVIILRSLLRDLIRRGCRGAQPGEFSKRAFINGKLDLIQAEAIMDMVSARSEQALTLALNQYGGKFSSKVLLLSQELLEVLANLEVAIDYPDMELGPVQFNQLEKRVRSVVAEIEHLLAGFDQARLYREGLRTAILGRPNVGKSSLLNILAGEERAIVTEIPGTTRDVLEVPVNIRGIPLLLLDTAGIRESIDIVEQMGVDRAHKAARSAQLVLLVFDVSQPLGAEDLAILAGLDPSKTIAVLNKMDLSFKIDPQPIINAGLRVAEISVVEEDGLEQLKDLIEGIFISENMAAQDLLVSNERHYQALCKACSELQAALAGFASLPPDLVALDIRRAWEVLGEITGRSWSEDLLTCIFGNFCLGK